MHSTIEHLVVLTLLVKFGICLNRMPEYFSSLDKFLNSELSIMLFGKFVLNLKFIFPVKLVCP